MIYIGAVVFPSLFALAAAERCDGASRSAVPHEYCVNGKLIGVVTSVRVVVGITCCLSMIGAALIILSYILIKDIRTKSRKILVNISLMDFMVAAGNLIGILINFDNYLYDPSCLSTHKYTILNSVCKAQAFISTYSTISSYMWTNCLAVYIYVQSMLMGQSKVLWSMCVFFILSYGLPLVVAIWYILTGKLGYSPYGGSGWCSVIVYNNITGERLPFNAVFVNDVWIYLTIVFVPLIFISLKCMSSTFQKVEMKLLFIPIFFILLRVWSLVLTIIEIEAGQSLNCPALLFFLHMGGIGDSGQGFANAILFVLFTPKVRRYFCRLFLCSWLCRKVEHMSSINNHSKSKAFYGAVQSTSSTDQREGFSHDSPEPSRDSDVTDIKPHSVLLNNGT